MTSFYTTRSSRIQLGNNYFCDINFDTVLQTLSHAPEWSHDVCQLLNPEAGHDWKLLAQRLGYSNDDIRNWATQPDPCMSLLDEWFATHKTREATHAVLKTLQEINRVDAATIVEKALKAVGEALV